VEDAEAAQQRLTGAHCEVSRAVVANLDNAVIEVESLNLTERSTRAHYLSNQLCDSSTKLVPSRGRYSAPCE